MSDILFAFYNVEDALPDDDDVIKKYDDLDGLELISRDHYITEGHWRLPYLYKDSQTGAILVWKIGYNPIVNKIIIKTGQEITKNGEMGKLTHHKREVKLNEHSLGYHQQALQETWNAYQKKYRDGYRPGHEEPVKEISAQLAQKIINKQTGKWVIEQKHLDIGVSCQGKIDGIRALIWPDNMIFRSRSNKKFKWLSHIIDELSIFFSYLPDNVALDGELFIKDVDFGKIVTAIMTTKYEHPTNKDLIYNIFDIIIPKTVVEDRIKILYNSFGKYLDDGNINKTFIILQQYYVYTYDQLNKKFTDFVKNKYEGMMVRKLSGIRSGHIPTETQLKESWYKPGKNNNLLKMKSFHEDEGIVIKIESAEGNDEGTAKFVIEWHGIRFGCRPEGIRELRKKWYDNQKEYIGKVYTFKYFELTKYGIPRFPTGKAFRDKDFYICEGKILDIFEYRKGIDMNITTISMFIIEVDLTKILIRDTKESNLGVDTMVKIKCIPSGLPSEHEWMIHNKEQLLGRHYKFTYMSVINNIPDNSLGLYFV